MLLKFKLGFTLKVLSASAMFSTIKQRQKGKKGTPATEKPE
jgi:hypothetical protein